MLTFFYILQIIIAAMLVVLVIFQKNEGGTGLISSNQYNSFFSSKSFAANPLTRITVILGVLLFLNSIVIGIYNAKPAYDENSDLINKIEGNLNTSKPNSSASSSDIPLGK
jgi:protein translocase SecG subunit